MGDKLTDLPTDKSSNPSQEDMDVILNLFKNKEAMTKVTGEFRHSIYGGILFLILSSSIFDNLIKSTGCDNKIYIMGIKLILFVILFYIISKRF